MDSDQQSAPRCVLCGKAADPEGSTLDFILVKALTGAHACNHCVSACHQLLQEQQLRRKLKKEDSVRIQQLEQELNQYKQRWEQLQALLSGTFIDNQQ